MSTLVQFIISKSNKTIGELNTVKIIFNQRKAGKFEGKLMLHLFYLLTNRLQASM